MLLFSCFSSNAYSKSNNRTLNKHYFKGIVIKLENGDFVLIESFVNRRDCKILKNIVGDTLFCEMNNEVKLFIVTDKVFINTFEEIVKYSEVTEYYYSCKLHTLRELSIKPKNIKFKPRNINEKYHGGQFMSYDFSSDFKIIIGAKTSNFDALEKEMVSQYFELNNNVSINKVEHLELYDGEGTWVFSLFNNFKIIIIYYYIGC